MDLKRTKLPFPPFSYVSFCIKYDLLLGTDLYDFVFWRKSDSKIFRYNPFSPVLWCSLLLNDFLCVFRDAGKNISLFTIQPDGSVKTDPVFSCRETTSTVSNIFLSKDNKTFSYRQGNHFFAWETKTWNLTRVIEFPKDFISQTRWRSDGNAMAIAFYKKEKKSRNFFDSIAVAYCDFSTVRVCPEIFKKPNYINAIHFESEDKIHIIVGKCLYEWNLNSDEVVVFEDLFKRFQYFFLGQNGSLVLIPDYNHVFFSIYDLKERRSIATISNNPATTGFLTHVFETKDNKYLLYFERYYVAELDLQGFLT